MSAFDNAQANSEAAGWVFAMAFNVTAVLKVTLLSIHSYNVYHDLFTKERKSVAHRRNMPAISKTYKIITYLTLFSIAMFTASSISGTATPFSKTDHACYRGGTSIVSFVQIGKTSMYMVFLVRLFQIYQKSAYSYPFKCIAFFCVILIIYGLGVIIFMIFVYAALVYTYGHHDYPNWCGPGASELFGIIAAMIIFEDLCAAIGFLIAFIVPLKKTLKAIENVGDNDPKVTRKILYAGTKTTVLTGVAVCSTLVLLFLTGALSGAFSIPDSPVNSICMMLMSAYYPDSKYYQKLCKCCICCCDKRGTRNELEEHLEENISNENEPTRTENVSSQDTATTSTGTTASSVDTMSQLRVAGKDAKVTYDINSDPEKGLAEIQQAQDP